MALLFLVIVLGAPVTSQPMAPATLGWPRLLEGTDSCGSCDTVSPTNSCEVQASGSTLLARFAQQA